MNRNLNVEPREGVHPWRAHPSAETTIGELERAVQEFDLDVVKTTAFEIILVQTAEQIRDGVPPPDIDELAREMFGDHAIIVTVEESGTFPSLDLDLPDLSIGDPALQPGKLDIAVD